MTENQNQQNQQNQTKPGKSKKSVTFTETQLTIIAVSVFVGLALFFAFGVVVTVTWQQPVDKQVVIPAGEIPTVESGNGIGVDSDGLIWVPELGRRVTPTPTSVTIPTFSFEQQATASYIMKRLDVAATRAASYREGSPVPTEWWPYCTEESLKLNWCSIRRGGTPPPGMLEVMDMLNRHFGVK